MKHFNDFLLMTIIKLKLEVGTNNSRNVLRDNFAFQLSSVSNWTWGPVEYKCNTMHPNLLFGQLPSRIEKNLNTKIAVFSCRILITHIVLHLSYYAFVSRIRKNFFCSFWGVIFHWMIKSITLYLIDVWLIDWKVRFMQTFYLLEDTIQSYIQYLH